MIVYSTNEVHDVGLWVNDVASTGTLYSEYQSSDPATRSRRRDEASHAMYSTDLKRRTSASVSVCKGRMNNTRHITGCYSGLNSDGEH